MDFQPGILGRLADSDALVERTRAAIDEARGDGTHVGFVRVAFDEADLARIPEHSRFAGLAASLPSDAPHTQVDERLQPQDGDIAVRKTRVGAFSTTDLDAQLRARGVTTLELAGISTSGVVLSTVRAAADLDYRLRVRADCCADPDPEVHAFLLERVLPRQAEIV